MNVVELVGVTASVIPYPAIVVGLPVNELNTPSNASVMLNHAIVVGLLVISAQGGVLLSLRIQS